MRMFAAKVAAAPDEVNGTGDRPRPSPGVFNPVIFSAGEESAGEETMQSLREIRHHLPCRLILRRHGVRDTLAFMTLARGRRMVSSG
jgi:hypothetical protein